MTITSYASFAQRMATTELMLELVTGSRRREGTPDTTNEGRNVLVTQGQRSWRVDPNGEITDLQTGKVDRA